MTSPDIADVRAGDWVKVTNFGDHRGVWEGHCWDGYPEGSGILLFGWGALLRKDGILSLGLKLLDHRPAPTPEPTLYTEEIGR